MKKQQFSPDNLDKLFNIEPFMDDADDIGTDLIPVSVDQSEEPASYDNGVENELINDLRDMYKDIKEIIDTAKFLVQSSPDADSLHASAQLFTAASNLLKELNRGVLENKKQQFLMKFEQMKIEARAKLQKDKSLNKIGNNNNINIQNNTVVPFSQERVIKSILEQKRIDEERNI